MRNNGATYKDIANEFNITISRAHYHYKKSVPIVGNESISSRIIDCVKLASLNGKKLSDRQIADMVECSRTYVRCVAKLRHLDIRIDDDMKVIRNRISKIRIKIEEAWRIDKSVNALSLSKEIGCSATYVYRILSGLRDK
jgi:hypothetical protein